MFFWSADRTYGWYRGFAIGINEETGTGNLGVRPWPSGREMSEDRTYKIWSWKNSRNVERSLAATIPGYLIDMAAINDLSAIDGVPWEIHAIKNKKAREIATRTFLKNARLLAHLGEDGLVKWPPFTRRIVPAEPDVVDQPTFVYLTFPTGEYTTFEVEACP